MGSRSYKVTVVYNSMHNADEPLVQNLFVSTTNRGLIALLRTLDSSNAVDLYTVATVTTLPSLSVITRLKSNDLGEELLNKLK